MHRLALCDDVSVQLDMLEDIVKTYCNECGFITEVCRFTSGEALLEPDEGKGFHFGYSGQFSEKMIECLKECKDDFEKLANELAD